MSLSQCLQRFHIYYYAVGEHTKTLFINAGSSNCKNMGFTKIYRKKSISGGYVSSYVDTRFFLIIFEFNFLK